jgi:hypothetical protein
MTDKLLLALAATVLAITIAVASTPAGRRQKRSLHNDR